MGMRRRKESRDQELWIATDKLAGAPGHVFYRKLNQLLASTASIGSSKNSAFLL